MEQLELVALPRQVVGKKVRFLRRQGLTPAHVFGHGIESQTIQVDAPSLKKLLRLAGTSRLIKLNIQGESPCPCNVLVRGVQRHPLTEDLLHVDFYQVRMEERIKAEVPLRLVGLTQTARKVGILVQSLHSVEVECLPVDMPPHIEIDVSHLTEVDQAIFVKDIPRQGSITILNDSEQTVAMIQAMPTERVEAAAPAAVAAGEEAVAGAEEKKEGPAPAAPQR